MVHLQCRSDEALVRLDGCSESVLPTLTIVDEDGLLVALGAGESSWDDHPCASTQFALSRRA